MRELPTTFGKYFLTEKLATGGMAEIYLAKIVGPGGFEKQLVIKQIHPKLTGQRPFVDLFVAEAKTLVTLTHGNIVPVYELGVVDDTYFIAMEYIDGPTLYRLTETLLRKGVRMAPPVAAWITARILEGLDYAHRKGEGVIHRDLSSRNVMLSRDGEVKLVDFGVAVTLGAGDDDDSRSAPTGSFPYMSPEQVRRESLTGQTDLFSAGVLCWEMLVGRRLFARSDPDAPLAAVTGDAIATPSSLRPDVPARLDEVVMRALERDRGTRWTDAAEMLAAIQKYLYALDDTPGPREVAALVARYCPPETRRLPTHADTAPDNEHEPTPPAGPRTAVIPRAATRQQTFATHVGFDDLFEREAAAASDEARVRGGAGRGDYTRGPSNGLLVVAGLGVIAMTIGAVWVFAHGRAAVLAQDDAQHDAQHDGDEPAAIDAGAPPSMDAGAVFDAGTSDAGVHTPRPTPRPAPRPTPVDATPARMATLKIGADPWGDVSIDGAPKGRAPLTVQVTAGKHTVDIVFAGEDPPRKQSFSIDVSAGATEPVFADFRDQRVP
jgi:serine/threonine-protein kinase